MGTKKGQERLDKLISAQTSLSRKDVHKLFSRGLVLMNGEPVRSFDTKANPDTDSVSVNGQPLLLKRYSYLMMNKPKGVVSATSDAALTTVFDLVPEELMRSGLFPAGRLDKDTTGFVLLTNDGEFAHRILSPKSHVPKVYSVLLDMPVENSVVQGFLSGVELGDEKCMPAELRYLENAPTHAQVILRQGIYHQVKRMFGAFGIGVIELHRDQIGGLVLDPLLEPGQCRELSALEVEKIACDL